MTGQKEIPNSQIPAQHSTQPLLEVQSERRIVAIAISTRAIHDVAARMVYPFLPEIAAGHLDRAGGIDGFIA